ncbi:MAG: mercury resistance system transport protein MerF [candidate division NC10 bacterium]|nr:mercury resistance system transport protein MerF [candidate division NC10 bacterium]
MDPFRLRRAGLTGAVLAALCCFTPVLGLLLGPALLAAWGGVLDLILFPLLAISIGVTLYAHRRRCRR